MKKKGYESLVLILILVIALIVILKFSSNYLFSGKIIKVPQGADNECVEGTICGQGPCSGGSPGSLCQTKTLYRCKVGVCEPAEEVACSVGDICYETGCGEQWGGGGGLPNGGLCSNSNKIIYRCDNNLRCTDQQITFCESMDVCFKGLCGRDCSQRITGLCEPQDCNGNGCPDDQGDICTYYRTACAEGNTCLLGIRPPPPGMPPGTPGTPVYGTCQRNPFNPENLICSSNTPT